MSPHLILPVPFGVLSFLVRSLGFVSLSLFWLFSPSFFGPQFSRAPGFSPKRKLSQIWGQLSVCSSVVPLVFLFVLFSSVVASY